MKLDKYTTSQLIGIQDRIHRNIERLKKNNHHNKVYEESNMIDTEDEISVIAQLYAASAAIEMVLERVE